MPFKEIPALYTVWQSMRQRCKNPKSRAWNDYGGRGVTICPEWDSYERFAEDMGPRPDGFSIDRINNDLGYSKANCRWADRKTQQRNQRRAIFVTIEGVRHRAIELAESAGVKTDTIIERARRGLPMSGVASPHRAVDTSGLALGGDANGRRQRAKTHCPKGHEYSADNLVASKQGFRSCKTCHRERARAKRLP